MERHKYPDLVAHRAAHHQLLETFEKLAKVYGADPIAANAETMIQYLKVWLTNHILVIDKRYSAHMIDCGVK